MNKQIKEMLDQIENLPPEFHRLDSVVYSAMELLKAQKMIPKQGFESRLMDIVVIYQTAKENKSQQEAEEFIKEKPEMTGVFFDEEDEHCFKYDEFCDYFGLPNIYDYEYYEILQFFIKEYGLDEVYKIGYQSFKDYELFSLLSLEYINTILISYFQNKNERNDAYLQANFIKNITGAYFSLDIAKELKQQEKNTEKEKTIAKKLLSQTQERGDIKDTNRTEK